MESRSQAAQSKTKRESLCAQTLLVIIGWELFKDAQASESVGRQTEQKKTKLNKKHDVVITQYHILRNVLLNCLSHTALSKDFFLTFTKIIHGKNISKIKVNLPILFK